MRILLVHNHYGSAAPSGENQVFELERDMLRRAGQEVSTFERHSDSIRRHGMVGTLFGGLVTPWNPWSARALRDAVDRTGAEVVHVHNTFPLLSPAIFRSIGNGAARVLTLHNYRLFCPAAIPLRDGHTCTECLDRQTAWPSIKYACYRGSRAATLPLAISVELHRRMGTWGSHVDAFIALSEFQRDLMVSSGLPPDKVWVKPNFYPGVPTPVPWKARRDVVVFAGRLSEEKGVAHLIDAWLAWGDAAPELRVLGDGPLRQRLERRVAMSPGRVVFMGRVSPAAAQAEIAAARLLILPSVCFEGFPMVIREAFAFGTPAAVSRIGPLPSIVEDGVTGRVFEPGSPESLLQVVRAMWRDPAGLERMGSKAHEVYEERYSEPANLELLLEIYDRARAQRRKGPGW